MKILIIGNGFDLAHYLPTAYAHFMGVMKAIEQLPEGKTEVTYDDLFAGLEKENEFFFGRTREIYDGDNMRFDVKKIYELKENLKNNKWYSFFKMHMEINTWIDFEERIKKLLISINSLRIKFDKVKADHGHCSRMITDFAKDNEKILFLDNDNIVDLICFDIFVGKDYTNINEIFSKKSSVGGHIRFIDFICIFKNLISDLNGFSNIFSEYLLVVVGSFSPKQIFLFNKIKSWFHDSTWTNSMEDLKRVYSFNYTSTLIGFYKELDFLKERFYFLHGQVGNPEKNIVLGVDSIEEGFLSEYNLYGFLKYHQKLMNNTDYLFLSEDELLMSDLGFSGEYLEINIWGHSMDVSDSDYIKEIFNFDRNFVRVKIFYFGSAKFDLLANLLKIVGREKIEKWMKKGWLKFEQAPDLYELNFSKSSK